MQQTLLKVYSFPPKVHRYPRDVRVIGSFEDALFSSLASTAIESEPLRRPEPMTV